MLNRYVKKICKGCIKILFYSGMLTNLEIQTLESNY